MFKMVYEGFISGSGRLGRLLDIAISEYDKYKDIVFISDEVTIYEIKQYLNIKNRDDILNKMLVLFKYSYDTITNITKSILVELNDNTLILMHTRKPFEIHSMLHNDNVFYNFDLTVYNYYQSPFSPKECILKESI